MLPENDVFSAIMEKIYTPEEIAERLKVQERTVYGWLRSGKLKGAKLGRLWRIRESDFDAFLEEASKRKTTDDEESQEPQ
jgi:excisionase family DNA binding protein